MVVKCLLFKLDFIITMFYSDLPFGLSQIQMYLKYIMSITNLLMHSIIVIILIHKHILVLLLRLQ